MTPQQAKACTDILAQMEGLNHFQRISVLTLLLGASINTAAKNPASAQAMFDLTCVQLRRHVITAPPAGGLG